MAEKTVLERIRDHLLQQVMDDLPGGLTDLEALKRTQWSVEFERLMRNRLLMGAYRYGDFASQKHDGKAHRNVESIIKRAKRYLADGNQEHLVDIANLAMVEFIAPGSHPSPHWGPTDDGDHVEVVNG